jgi:hypothetical protein
MFIAKNNEIQYIHYIVKTQGASPLLQGTQAALWLASAIFFSCPDYQGVELVKKLHIISKIVHKKFLQIMICDLVIHQIMSMQDAVGIGINDEYRTSGCIEDNAVCGLWPDPFYREKSISQLPRFLLQKAGNIPAIFFHDKIDQVL